MNTTLPLLDFVLIFCIGGFFGLVLHRAITTYLERRTARRRRRPHHINSVLFADSRRTRQRSARLTNDNKRI